MREIIKTNDGYMVQLPSGDYLCDENGNNLFDTFVEANALAQGLDNPAEGQTNWAKANEAFYKWERDFGEVSDLSDDDRMIWIEGYLQALRDAK
jgi:hypothetical protein